MALPAKKERYTFADYLTWDEYPRYELIDGEAIMLASPSSIHQIISMELSRQFANYLEGKKCRVISAPFDVRLFEREGDRPEDVQTVVQPDISIICDQNKLDEHGCKGAPDLTLEILSPSNAHYDLLVKLNLYQRAGVREYWVVSPEDKTVNVFLLDRDVLALRGVYGPTDLAKVSVLDGCFIELSKVFPA
ncbi:Uma2 family endonuclease [Colidextribacter sp. OB.20]|uniref:Uma2 family endonuclease n=1 Tax=Colidextribacter sp. OB.20 TaxID=2304568 RepID=UPI00136EBB63|nr:Uma2 family endonuclease [Colidextribacter sp. OB.20]NBI10709.1 Uma2 family endonuclease [Colidextribacter sp. OB.20]